MTGPEHYAEAERLLEETGQEFDVELEALPTFMAQVQAMIARAQVHATLALAAASGLNSPGATTEDNIAWLEAASEWKKSS